MPGVPIDSEDTGPWFFKPEKKEASLSKTFNEDKKTLPDLPVIDGVIHGLSCGCNACSVRHCSRALDEL